MIKVTVLTSLVNNVRATLTRGLLVLASLVVLQTQMISSASAEVTFLNKWGSFGTGDGKFDDPRGIALSDTGQVYVVDRYNDRKHLITGLDENPVEGYLQVPKGPGWGVSLNEEYIRMQMEKEATSCQTCDGTGRIGPRIARQIHAVFDEDGALLDS